MDAFMPRPRPSSNCNTGTGNDCVEKHLNDGIACYDGNSEKVSDPTYSNYPINKQNISNESLQGQDLQNSVLASSFHTYKNNQFLNNSSNFNLIRTNCLLPPSSPHSASCRRIEQFSSATSQSLEGNEPTLMTRSYSDSANKSPIFKQRLKQDSDAGCKISISSDASHCDPMARSGVVYSKFRRHSDKMNWSVTPRPPIRANQIQPSTLRQNLSEPNHTVYNVMPQSLFHSGPMALQLCPINNLHIQQNFQNKESPFHLQNYPLQNQQQWHVPQQQHTPSSKHETSLVFSYESPNVQQLPICSSPFSRLFSPSKQQHEETSDEMQNADHFNLFKDSMLSHQMTPKRNKFFNPAQEINQWPHQLCQTQLTCNNSVVSSQAVTSPYFVKSGTNSHQHSHDPSPLPCQTKLIKTPTNIPIEVLGCRISSCHQEKQSNVSSFVSTPQSSNASNANFHAAKISRSVHSNQSLPICQSDSQLMSLENLNKALPRCQMKLETISKAEEGELVMATKLEKDNTIFHQKEIFKPPENIQKSNKINCPSNNGPVRVNVIKARAGTQSQGGLKASTFESPNQNNKSKVWNTAGYNKNICSKEKIANESVGISAANRINPRSSITSIKAKSKLIIKSVESSSVRNCIASKIDASTEFTKPVVSVQTSRKAGIDKVYIKQNQQNCLMQPNKIKSCWDTHTKNYSEQKQLREIQPTPTNCKSDNDCTSDSDLFKLYGLKPSKPSLLERKFSLEVLDSTDNIIQLNTFCKHCDALLELKNSSHCFHCEKPLFNATRDINSCNKSAVATSKNSEALPSESESLPSESESLGEKQQILVTFYKKPTEELKICNDSDIDMLKEKNGMEANQSEQNDTAKINSSVEQEIFILSSDDDEQSHRKHIRLKCEPQAINALEQDVVANINLEKNSYLSGGGLPFDEDWDQESNFESVIATKIHIGNFEIQQDELGKTPSQRVFFRKDQIQFEVTAVIKGKEGEAEWLKINAEDIEIITCHFGDSVPGSVMMVLLKPGPAEQIKKKLGMTEESKFNFDPFSSDPTVNYVILKLESLSEFSAGAILGCFNLSLIQVVDRESMNNLLIETLSEGEECGYPSQTLLIYPPPPSRGGITITTKDYYCLEEGQFLNDVILDFYLKYLVLEKLSQENKERTHLFSTFFYKRLTSKPKKNVLEDNCVMVPSEIRHARVKSWTKNVDIFEKDFIIIPINERSHWFLAVICFPGLISSTPVTLIRNSACVVTNKELLNNKQSKAEIPIVEDVEWSDKDEAESDDDDIFVGTKDEPQTKKLRQENDTEVSEINHKIQFSGQPCILIFDSLAGASRSRIVATLRDYLSVEYYEKKKRRKIFSKDLIKGVCLNVPQQTNFTDCGIFTLQFAESFFEAPLKTFKFPMPSLANWFTQDRVACKREQIARKIEKLMNEFKPNHGIKLMKIIFKSSDEDTNKSIKVEKKVTEKHQIVSDLRNIKSKVIWDTDSVKPKELQISNDTSKEIIVEVIRPASIVNTLPRIPKRPLTPGPYKKPEPKYQTPLLGLYGDKDSVLQRSIVAKSISITDINHSSTSNNGSKIFNSKFASNSSNFSKPKFLKVDKTNCKAVSSSLEGGGIKSKSEDEDVIFENEVLTPKLGYRPFLQKQIVTTVKEVKSLPPPNIVYSYQGKQHQTPNRTTVFKRKSVYDFND